MTRTTRGRVAILPALLIALSGAASAQQPEPVFRAAADAVSVDVSVQRGGRPVTDLQPADFTVLDNGVPQEVSGLTYERLPVDVTLLLDVSASVSGVALEELRRAVRQLRADLRPDDRLRLLTFNMRPYLRVDFGSPAGDLDAALTTLSAGGSSAVFDSLAVALAAPDAPGRRRLLVLLSDGQDSSSSTDPASVIDIARRSGSTVAIMLGSAGRDRPASLLRATRETVGAFADRLALETGGMVSAIAPGESLASRFRRMLQDFRTSYVLYFTPRGVDRAGVHTLDVRVKREGVAVRARRTYVAGE